MESRVTQYAPQLVFTAVVFCAGLFAGLTIAAELALQSSASLTLPAWASAVETIRTVAVAIIVCGLGCLVVIEWVDGAETTG